MGMIIDKYGYWSITEILKDNKRHVKEKKSRRYFVMLQLKQEKDYSMQNSFNIRLQIRMMAVAFLTILVGFTVTAFAAETQAHEIHIPEGTTIIGMEAFAGDESIDSIVLPEGLQQIEDLAFAGLSIGEVYLPSSLEFIADNAFDQCEQVRFRAEWGSYAYEWAVNHGTVVNPRPEFWEEAYLGTLPDYERELPVIPVSWVEQTDWVINCDNWVSWFGLANADALREAYGDDYEWTIELVSGEDLDAWLDVDSSGESVNMNLNNQPMMEGDSVYQISCRWGDAANSFTVTLHNIDYSDYPAGVLVPDDLVMRIGNSVAITADFDPAGWAVPGETVREFSLWSEDDLDLSEYFDIDYHGTTADIHAKQAGTYHLGGALRSDGVLGYVHITLTVLPETDPVTVTAELTDYYHVVWLLVDEAEGYTVYTYTDPECNELFCEQAINDTSVTDVYVSTDCQTKYWFVLEYDCDGEGHRFDPVTVEPLSVLDAPENVAADISEDGTLLLSWDAVDEASGYRVYWSYENDEWTVDTEYIYLEGETEYSGLDLNDGQSICIWVCADKGNGANARSVPFKTRRLDLSGSRELARTESLGIGSYNGLDRIITFSEFASMLDQLITLYGAERNSNWLTFYQNAVLSDAYMTRREGMVAVYLAAEAMGPEYYIYNDIPTGIAIFQQLEDNGWPDFDAMNAGDYQLFPPIYVAALNGEDSYTNAAFFYSMRRVSRASGNTIFDFDSETRSMRPADPLTYSEALLAAIRMFESYVKYDNTRPETDADLEILQKADNRRNEILSSVTEVDVTGTRYYVSANGNDNNDGRSIDRPWASLDKVNSANLQPGDGVFFCRGDVWRGALKPQAGVTYSAYGEGPKPAIYGSPENGAGSGKWNLLEGTSNIWVYHIPMMDCGDMVIDGSMDVVNRASVWWTGDHYVAHSHQQDNYDILTNRPAFDPASDLANHEYFCDIDFSGQGSEYPIYVFTHVEQTGTLYLRCDEGNPGLLYQSIEFCCDPSNGCVVNAWFADGMTLDNLSILYCGHAVEASGIYGTVQNCEIGYMGAMYHTFASDTTVYSGDGISHGNGMLIQNNYVHHAFSSGIAPGEMGFAPDENYGGTQDIQRGNIVRSNLLEYTSGIVLINWEPEVNENHIFRDITIEDNYVLYTRAAGDEIGAKSRMVMGSLVFSDSDTPTPCANENLIVKDNIFYCSQNVLLISAMSEQYYPVYSGNTYAQYENAPFAYWRFRDGTYKEIYTSEYPDLEEFIRNELGDATGIILR